MKDPIKDPNIDRIDADVVLDHIEFFDLDGAYERNKALQHKFVPRAFCYMAYAEAMVHGAESLIGRNAFRDEPTIFWQEAIRYGRSYNNHFLFTWSNTLQQPVPLWIGNADDLGVKRVEFKAL